MATYLGAKRTNSAIVTGVKYLESHPPTAESRDSDYWYFATLVMYRQSGGPWDNWNRQTRRLLIGTQEKSGCASGSWNPEEPNVDAAHANGRLYVTALATLSLEIYYRYLPLYKDIGQP